MTALSEALRWANVLLAFLSLAAMTAIIVRRWDSLPRRLRRVAIGVCMLLATVAYGSGEAARQDAPLGLRVVMAFVSLAVLAWAVLWPFDEDA